MDIELFLNEKDHKLALYIKMREIFIQEWIGIEDEDLGYGVLRVRYSRDYEDTDKIYYRGMLKDKPLDYNRQKFLKCPYCNKNINKIAFLVSKLKEKVKCQCPHCKKQIKIELKVINIA